MHLQLSRADLELFAHRLAEITTEDHALPPVALHEHNAVDLAAKPELEPMPVLINGTLGLFKSLSILKELQLTLDGVKMFI